MDVSPQLIREIEFREQWRGYNPDEVDDFLERLAVAVEQLQERLRHLSDRPAPSAGDEELRRTLVLAQRTADAAVAEAREEGARIVAEAEERARRLLADAQARADAELGELRERRAALEADVEVLTSYVEQHRGRLRDELRRQLEWLDDDGLPAPPSLSRADRAPEPEPTGLYDALAEDDADDDAGDAPDAREVPRAPEAERRNGTDVDAGEARVESGPPDDDDDPFLAELRRAVTDPEPLGPRHHEGHDAEAIDLTEPDDTGELAPASRLRRRRRR